MENVSGAWASDGERVFLMGGSDNAFNDTMPFYESVWELDMVTEVWDPLQPLLVTGVREAAGAWVDGALHVFGGSNGAEVAVHQVASFDPVGGTGGSSDGGSSDGGSSDGGSSDGGSSGTSGGGGTLGSGSTGPSNDTSAGPLDDSGGATGASSLGGSGAGSGDDGSTGGAMTTPDGCSCRSSDGHRPPVWSWLVVLVGLRSGRRRRH